MKDIVLNEEKITAKVNKIRKINEELEKELSGMIDEIEVKHNQLCFAWNQIGEFCSENINRNAFFEISELEEIGYSPYFCAKFEKHFIGVNPKDRMALAEIIGWMNTVITRLNEWAEN